MVCANLHIACISVVLLAGTIDPVRASLLRQSGKSFPWIKRLMPHLDVEHIAETCVDVTSKDTFYTVDLQVGTPVQTVTVVVDTGSRPLVIESCACKEGGSCSSKTRCFAGPNVSSTFSVADASQQTPMIQLSYGSGDILTAIGTDVVRMGSLTKQMDSNLFIMFANMMSFDPADGILGLSPRSNDPLPNLFTDFYKNKVPPLVEGFPPVQVPDWRDTGFFEAAGVDRFSLCLNSASGDGGALHMNVPKLANPMTSIESNWWGVGLWGMSVGNKSISIEVCNASTMEPGQRAPCAAIPDSGTTFLLAPNADIHLVFSGVCEAWPRCRDAYAERPGALASDVFQELLFNCSDWISASKDISEVPSLHFQLAGAEDSTNLNTIELEPSTWIFESETGDAYLKAHPSSRIRGLIQTTSRLSACTAAIGTSSEPKTKDNGPLWILGLPLFAKYALSFDISDKPGQISFDRTACASCNQDGSLLSHSVGTIRKHTAPPLRMRSFDHVN